MYVWGVDPDSDAHGVAVYHKGDLIALGNLTHEQFRKKLAETDTAELIVSMEDVMSNTSTFRAGRAKNKAVSSKMGHAIGRLYQSQKVLIEMLDDLGVRYVTYPPSSYWKSQSGKRQFEKITGWTGRSNEDTRSAAYFGFLALRKFGGS